MEKIKLFLFGFIFVLLFSQCGPTKQDAINYNNKIIAEQLLVIDAVNKLGAAVLTYNPSEIKEALKSAKEQVEKAIKDLEEIGSFNNDSTFFNECMLFYKTLENQINNEYVE